MKSWFQAHFIRATLICSPILKHCSLQFVTCFWLQFSPMPRLVLFIISMGSWEFWLTKKINQPFSGPVYAIHWQPVLVRHYSFRQWADIDFCFVPCTNVYINLPFEVCQIHFIGHWVCPRGPFCSQHTLIKETEITGEIYFNIIHHHHCSNRPHYSCCIFHLPSL